MWTLLLKAFRADDSQMEEAEIAQTLKRVKTSEAEKTNGFFV